MASTILDKGLVMFKTLVLTTALVFISPNLFAYDCMKPADRAPACTSTSDNARFQSQPEFDSCKTEVSAYVKSVQTWLNCVREAAQKEVNEATKTAQALADQAANQLNCKTRGDGDCA